MKNRILRSTVDVSLLSLSFLPFKKNNEVLIALTSCDMDPNAATSMVALTRSAQHHGSSHDAPRMPPTPRLRNILRKFVDKNRFRSSTFGRRVAFGKSRATRCQIPASYYVWRRPKRQKNETRTSTFRRLSFGAVSAVREVWQCAPRVQSSRNSQDGYWDVHRLKTRR